MSTAPVIRFDQAAHEYTLNGDRVRHITELLELGGWSDNLWYTEASRIRGSAVHDLTAQFDLGAITQPESVTSIYKPWFLAYASAPKGFRSVTQVAIETVEEPRVHPRLRFGGRIDRSVRLYGIRGILEIKTGQKERAHGIQTGIQSVLLEPEIHIPAHLQGRWTVYLSENGKWELEAHPDRRDIDEAMRLIRKYCR